MEQTPAVQNETGYMIRIIRPTDEVIGWETRGYTTLDEAKSIMEQVGEKLLARGITEFEIHVVSAETGKTVQTLQRKVL